jgi:DNA-binding GntR family transcriptional regulator
MRREPLAVIDPVARQSASLRGQVTDRVRDAILDGRLHPGQKLVERELCTLLGVSRTLLREVLQQLQAEGLITSVPHRGPSVALIGADEVSEIYEARVALESVAGSGFARHATDEQVRVLRQTFEKLRLPEAQATPRSMLLAKNDFYSVLLDGCGNRVIAQVLVQLNNRMMLFKRLSLSTAGRIPQMVEELEAIVEAIEARDTERAAARCRDHVSKAAKTVQHQLKVAQEMKQEHHGQEHPTARVATS